MWFNQKTQKVLLIHTKTEQLSTILENYCMFTRYLNPLTIHQHFNTSNWNNWSVDQHQKSERLRDLQTKQQQVVEKDGKGRRKRSRSRGERDCRQKVASHQTNTGHSATGQPRLRCSAEGNTIFIFGQDYFFMYRQSYQARAERGLLMN